MHNFKWHNNSVAQSFPFQGTHGVVTNSPQPTLIVLCLKLTSVVGFTWILGFVFAIANSSYVECVYTVINSLQGKLLVLGRT